MYKTDECKLTNFLHFFSVFHEKYSNQTVPDCFVFLHTYSEMSVLSKPTFGDNDPEKFMDDSVLQFTNTLLNPDCK